MRKYLLAAVAVAAVASPAMARVGAGYVGVEGGILFPRHSNYNTTANRSTVATTSSVTTPYTLGVAGTPGAPVITSMTTTGTTTYNSGFNADYKRGVDLDAIAGYDFGSSASKLSLATSALALVTTPPIAFC